MESELLWLLTENPHIFLSGHLVTILGGVLKSLPGAMEEKVFSGAAGDRKAGAPPADGGWLISHPAFWPQTRPRKHLC